MSRDKKLPTEGRSDSADVDAFLRRVAATPAPVKQGETGRLIFAMDATASREPTWDGACQIQGEMFDATASLGRALGAASSTIAASASAGASRWVQDSRALVRAMTAVHCLGGHTQLRKVLRHALDETQAQRVHALVFVGDSMEEDVDELCAIAGELGLRGVPAFMFHEGADPAAALAFRQIARLTNGAYLRFDASSARQLKELLGAVAVYAAGGRKALKDYSRERGEAVLQIAHQIK